MIIVHARGFGFSSCIAATSSSTLARISTTAWDVGLKANRHYFLTCFCFAIALSVPNIWPILAEVDLYTTTHMYAHARPRIVSPAPSVVLHLCSVSVGACAIVAVF